MYLIYKQLNTLRTLNNAVGIKLDGIGDIVVMSRAEAALLAGYESAVNLPDKVYRIYLKYKIFLNTSNGTYRDVLNGLKMFAPNTPLFYSEESDHPATMYFDTPDISEDEIEALFTAPIARSGGVQVVIRVRTKTPLERNIIISTLKQYNKSFSQLPKWNRPGDERDIGLRTIVQFKLSRRQPEIMKMICEISVNPMCLH
ncbi:hypothetical protein FACS1894105_09790 [Clostridia bacterium]|nr:hypothetical protein FACS1894105_09790 [Clostridia bacterium]